MNSVKNKQSHQQTHQNESEDMNMAENTVPTRINENTSVPAHETTRDQERYVTPPVDIYETNEGLVVVADMPGLERENLEISVEQDVLTIKGTFIDNGERDFFYREFTPSSYFRQFNLGNKIDQTRIDAQYRNGVMRLTLPFAEAAKPRTIEVKLA
jgi:HSP20 family protein